MLERERASEISPLSSPFEFIYFVVFGGGGGASCGRGSQYFNCISSLLNTFVSVVKQIETKYRQLVVAISNESETQTKQRSQQPSITINQMCFCKN